MAGSGGVSAVRPHAAVAEPFPNGALRNKASVVPPRALVPLNSFSEPKMFLSGPQGVFPRPPPARRAGAQESPTPGPAEVPSRVRLTGELLQSKILKQQSDMTFRPPLPAHRSVSEVVPLRKPLPSVGPRPAKPKRPPSVNLDHLHKKAPVVLPKRPIESQCLKGPARPPNKPSQWTAEASIVSLYACILQCNLSSWKYVGSHVVWIRDEQETYDDISALPPPPPPPPKPRDSWTDSYPSQHEDSDQDIYEDPDIPVPAERRVSKENKKVELDKKELKEKQKRENEYRKKFKLTGPIEAIHTARVREDWQGGKNDLTVRQGENVEIIRVNNNPEGKWLARNLRGSFGYISNSCVDVDYEEVKRKIRGHAGVGPDCYDDIGASDPLDSSFHSDDVYDDVDQEFPPPPPEISHDPKMAKLQEKEFRKKFKFEGPIRVLYSMMVDPNASLKKVGSKELAVMRGEVVEVLQESSRKRVLCRSSEGRCESGHMCYPSFAFLRSLKTKSTVI
ncbi:FYN-binding protein 1 [Rhinichthys klamathensis goyatoka]|uniref:FYN-binding protein 1 n=1 Tax=Rhinichthys klamathensis goyatoka TaxID=3034132 RepID=UPI0024B5010E|nr:FYN-binding protein 1 [Rhinichthys klamathensis goyatoka]